ncbi:MAG: hypothetical protein EAX90_06740 [Candidatus Heimdallarchaeota archaeon]|nr:hypothetical protein [Candidatus Heimdallarchaeota archaeon]
MNNSTNHKIILVFTALLIGLIASSQIISTTNSVNKEELKQILNPLDENEEDEDEDGIDDSEEEQNEREIEIETDDDEIKIQSKLSVNESADEFSVVLKAEVDSLKVKFEYSTEVNSTESELEFSVEFREIIEYNDTNNDEMFDEEDTIIQTYDIGNFLPIDYHFENRTDAELHIFNVTTTDGIFSVIVYATNEFAKINDTIIAPTQVKIDIRIMNFNYLESDTALALDTKFETEGSIEYKNETEDEIDNRAENETEIEINLNDYSGFFSWNDYALIDGINRSVIVSTYDIHTTEQKIYFNYYRGNEIIHDPKIGVENILVLVNPTTDTTFEFPLFTFTGLIVVGIIASILLGLTRFRRKRN